MLASRLAGTVAQRWSEPVRYLKNNFVIVRAEADHWDCRSEKAQLLYISTQRPVTGHRSSPYREIHKEVHMLVLSRKEAERIRLGDSIVITVVRIGGDKVRLGIQAPKDMLVLRDELEPFEKNQNILEIETDLASLPVAG
jgi:carbon storage regulator